jgi:hypothetical protein
MLEELKNKKPAHLTTLRCAQKSKTSEDLGNISEVLARFAFLIYSLTYNHLLLQSNEYEMLLEEKSPRQHALLDSHSWRLISFLGDVTKIIAINYLRDSFFSSLRNEKQSKSIPVLSYQW